MFKDEKTPDEYAEEARSDIAAGNYAEAIEKIDKAIDKEPRNPSLHLIRADALYRQGNYSSAIEELNFTEHMDKNNPELFSLKSICYGSMGDFKRSKEEADKAIKADQSYPFAYYNRAAALRGLGDVDGAEKDFRKYIEMQPSDPDPHYDLAEIYFEKKDYKKAMEEVKAVLRNDKSNEKAYDLKLQIHLATNDGEGYFKALLEAFKNTENFKYIGTLTDGLIGIGSYDTAEDILKQFIKVYEKEPYLYDLLARTYDQEGKAKEADETYNTLLRLNNSRESHIYWFDYLLDSGRYDDLLSEIEKSGFKDEEILEIEYIAQDASGKHEEALKTAGELVKMDQTPYSRSLYATQLRKLGKLEDALTYLGSGDQDSDEVQFEKFNILLEMGNHSLAMESLKNSITASDDDEERLGHLITGISSAISKADFNTVNNFLDGLKMPEEEENIAVYALKGIVSGIFESYSKGKDMLIGLDEDRDNVCDFASYLANLMQGKASEFLNKFIEENCKKPEE
ncbi:tetratricopeptide repeat protein [Thermoplasma volcanium]|nr:tetratricopeptide repeat protein [Thermoplasma volcanium]